LATTEYSPALVRAWRNYRQQKQERYYRISVVPDENSLMAEIPELIVSDIDGCITPPFRTEINPYKLARLRAYCRFAAKHPEYPSLCFYTGRSQGYAEFLAQVLGMTKAGNEIPFIIENGAALYYPVKKETVLYINSDQIQSIGKARLCLEAKLYDNEFEIKTFMVTINPKTGEKIAELHERVVLVLNENSLMDEVVVTQTASFIDISPKGISKFEAVKKAVDQFVRGDSIDEKLRKVVALGDQQADRDVLTSVGKAFCPADADQALKNELKKINPDSVIDIYR
jgi:hydroxymethylpyrimidine pyrophosphatase-like HAD family hydrolase